MKALHYQTQKEQKSLEERLAQEEVGKIVVANIVPREKPFTMVVSISAVVLGLGLILVSGEAARARA